MIRSCNSVLVSVCKSQTPIGRLKLYASIGKERIFFVGIGVITTTNFSNWFMFSRFGKAMKVYKSLKCFLVDCYKLERLSEFENGRCLYQQLRYKQTNRYVN